VRSLLHRGRRRSWVINGFIVLAVALVVLTTWRSVRSEASEPTTQSQTATVDTGAVTATVSASGNVDAASETDVSFEGTGGTVEKIYVAEGDTVKEGQALAEVDQTSARLSLQSAKAQLDAAQASYTSATEGRTSAERAQDAQTVNVAQTSVSSAQTQLTQARQSLALTKRQQDAAVARAEAALTAAQDKDEARSALVQAREGRDTAVLQAQQQVTSAESQVRSAQAQLASTQAQVAVNAEGPTDDVVASAQSQVDQAKVSVAEAQETLQQTVLRAPTAGTVASINGSVGASSSSSGSASSSSDSTSTTASTSTGFLTLSETSALEVTAYVAEADIDDVEVGQTATVTLSASDTEKTGEVTAVDTEPTVTNNVVEYGVTVRLDDAEGVRIGATAELVVSTGEKQDVTRVSSAALTTIGQSTTATVQADDGTTSTVAVTVGLVGDNQTEVLDGLAPGDVVVVPQTDSGDSSGLTFPGAGGGGFPGGGGGAPGGF
jgi:HlyD family secretion protein